MAFSDNNPTFKYVKISGLNIIHEGISYKINDIYSSSKYFYWDKNKSPNELITSNIRLTESVSCFLICMNDRGIHTEVNHDELIYNFGGYTSGGGNGGEISKTEFNALKVQVDENKSAYMNVSQAVEGINQVIGETEELKDGSIVKNLNVLKQTSDSMDLKIQELDTKISDEYEELRDMCSDSLVDLLASISTLKIDFEHFAEEDEELSEEGENVITTDIENTRNKLNALKGIVDGVLIILNEGERFEEHTDLNSAFTDMSTDITNMLSIINTAISDTSISSDDITTVILSIGTATQKLNILKATVDEIMTLGLGGTIYDNYSQIHIDNERIRTTVKQTESIIYGALKASVPEYYSSTSTEILIGGGWQDTPPPWEGGRYIWQRLRHEYASGQISYSKPVCLAGAKGDRGEDGSSVKILGSYDTYEELIEAHPLDNENGDGYLIQGDLYVWTGTQFESVGRIKGENGLDAHIHIKYSNDGGLTFTGNNGEDSGLYMGICSDFNLTDSSDVNDYTWSLIKGEDGKDGLNGIDGINGEDGVSIIWKGTATEHPSDPENGWAYYDSAQGKSFVYQDGAWYQMTVDGKDGVDGNDGENGLSIEYKGELSSPPSSPQKNWTYKDTDNGIVYIYTGMAWEVLTYDGSDGADGANGADGKSVFVTYNDSETTPATPTGDGTTNGWHTTCRNTSIWMSQKIASSAKEGAWGTPIRMKGIDGVDGEAGADGVNGEDGVSIVFKGEFEEHPSDPENGWAYYNSIQKKSYVYQSGTWYQMTVDGADGIKGNDGADGLSIVWRGELKTPPTRPEKNWVYRDTDNGIVYIYNGSAWEAMTYDGSDGVNGADGKDGLPIVWKGELETPPDDAVENWIYRDTDDGIIYIYTGEEWVVMTIDGVDGEDGKDGENGANGSSLLIFTTDYSTTQITIDAWSKVGYKRNWVVKEDISNVQAEDKALLKVHNTDKESDAFIIIKVNSVNADTKSINATSYGLLDRGENGNDGMSVFITYNDSLSKPDSPTGDGTTNGWHTNATDETRWMSQKVASSAEEGTWGEPIKIKGEDGSSVKILGAYNSLEELLAKHPSESNQNGDGYLINGDLYVWDGDEFLNVGRIKGEDGEDGISMYFHVKYSNDGGLTFTANNGETEGIYIGTYADREEMDSTDVTKYKWVKLKGQSLVKSTPEWYLSTSKTNQTGGSWSTTIPELKDGYYLWLRYKMEWENPTQTTYSTPTVERIYENMKEIAEKQATMEQDLNGFKTTVSTTYATKKDVTDVEDYLSNNYTTSTEMESIINQKADEITSSVSSTYATKVDVDNNTRTITGVAEKQAAMELNLDGFKTEVSNTYATKEEVGADNYNLLNNGKFENCYINTEDMIPSWICDKPSLKVYEAQEENEFGCLVLYNDSDTTKVVKQKVVLEEGKTYTLTFKASWQDNVNGGIQARIDFYNNDGGYSDDVIQLESTTVPVINNENELQSFTFTTPVLVGYSYSEVKFLIGDTAKSNGGYICARLGEVKLENGDIYTGWRGSKRDEGTVINGQNLITNGDFSSFTLPKTIADWKVNGDGWIFDLTGEKGYNKTGCIYFAHTSPDDLYSGFFQRIYNLKRRTEYTLTFYIGWEDNVRDFYVDLVFQDKSNSNIIDPVEIRPSQAGTWSYTFVTPDIDFHSMNVGFCHRGVIEDNALSMLGIAGNVKLMERNCIDSSSSVNLSYVTKTEFEQTSEDFTFKISQSSSGNLLKNTKFKDGTAYWNLWNWDDVNITGKFISVSEPWTSWNYNKERALKIDAYVENLQDYVRTGFSSARVSVKPNTQYTFSCYVDCHRVNRICFEVYSNNEGDWKQEQNIGIVQKVHHTEFNTNYTEWARHEVTFTTKENTTELDIRAYMDMHDNASNNHACMWIALPCLVEGTTAMEWMPHESELYDGIVKINQDGITVTQSSSNNTYTSMSASGFKSIHNNGSNTTMNANGLVVTHNNGSKSTMNADGFTVTHSDGSYTRANANGLLRYASGTGKYYHYLQYAGEYICNSEAQVQITLPAEFKGKNFQVITAVKRIYVAYLDYISYARFPLLSFYAEARNINHSAGTFEIYASIRAWNRTGVSGMGTVVGTNDTAAETEAVKPVVAYWVYA